MSEVINLPRIECKKCGHKSIPRVAQPLKCPRCGAPYKFEEKPK